MLVTQRRSDDALYPRAQGPRGGRPASRGHPGLYRIGDCVAPRMVADCVFDGHRLAREIDSEDPATPKPYLRERKVIELLRA